jgi:hypothetical protein
MLRKGVLIILSLSCFHFSFPQSSLADSNNSINTLQYAKSLYYDISGDNIHLYNGSEYPGYDISFIGNPFFDTTAMVPGSIFYDGTLYENVPMLFDIQNDAVVIYRRNVNFKIRLVNEKIDHFTFLSHEFLRIAADSNNKFSLPTGFYDRVYNGNSTFLVQRKKFTKDDPVVNGEVKTRFIEFENYFVKQNNRFYPVKTRKSVLALFKDKEKDLRRFIKKNKLKFKKKPEYAILQVVRYYDQTRN